MKFGREAKVGIGVAAAYRASGQTRAEFCREQGLPVTTLDYYLRREVHHSQQKLIPVRVIPEAAPTKPGSGFTLVLTDDVTERRRPRAGQVAPGMVAADGGRVSY